MLKPGDSASNDLPLLIRQVVADPLYLSSIMAICNLCSSVGLLPGPLLIAAAVAGPDFHGGAIGGAGADHIEAETGLVANDSAVGAEGPLLVRAVVAVAIVKAYLASFAQTFAQSCINQADWYSRIQK